ncbi:TonB-dependent receptor [hydrothermal vent metagenome]|uniref:TonB-dependent receptor n=1 Tax=hydrothermal vent metagenome TaxID=652676 RepID=A0A3B0UPB9_9ZZZZ
MKRFYTLLLFLATAFSGAGQMVALSGYIIDKASGEALIAANCYFPEISTGVISNSYGFYSITVPKGTYNVIFSYIGYKTQEFRLELNENRQLTILMVEETKHIEEVTVSGERKDRNVESIDMSMEKVSVKLVKKLPAFMGEVDVLKAITLLPGIQSGGEGSSGLYVRGGGPDENLLILDEAPVYNASHLMGFFSVFNSDAIKDIQVYKGGIPAKYGGKASSVVDIRMKDGNTNEFHGNAGIGNISSRLTLEGPVVKDKWSYIISGRRTYADFIGRLAGIEALQKNKLYFYDLNIKTNIRFSNNDHFFISGYTGDDYFKLGESIYMRWGNITGTLRWNHIFGSKLFFNTSLIYSKYDYKLGVPGNSADQFEWNSQIKDFNIKEEFSWFLNSKNKVNFGINLIYHHFDPGNVTTSKSSFYKNITLTNYNALENAIYASNEQKAGRKLIIRYGFRLSFFQQIGEGKVREYLHPDAPDSEEVISVKEYGKGEWIDNPYINLEPRLSARYSLDKVSSIKASYNRMVQNLHLISNTNSPTPLDIWLPTSKYIKPLIADQVALGYFRNFKNNTVETSVEVYYKGMQNVIDYKDGAELFLNEDLETELLHGKGYSYGLEVLAKKQEGKITGWVSYTLAKTMRKIPGINDGEAYPSSYDRTHDVSLVLNYELSKRFTLSATWLYATGNPVTYPIAKYYVQGNTLYYYAKRNSNRIPDYHRLDFSATYNPKKNEHRRIKQTLNLSFYNVYSRRNAYSVTFRQNEDNPRVSEAIRLSIIGSVVPAITYNFNF